MASSISSMNDANMAMLTVYYDQWSTGYYPTVVPHSLYKSKVAIRSIGACTFKTPEGNAFGSSAFDKWLLK